MTASRALQPVVPTAGDLAPFANTEAAKRLERLEADAELVLHLALRNYEGAEWQGFAGALAEYGFQVIGTWTRSGLIFLKCAEKGLGLKGLRWMARSLDDADEVAGETVAVAIRAFRDKVLIPRRWDPTKGATLKTFFIGQCIFQFPNVFRRWAAEQDQPPVDAETIAFELDRAARHSPETLAEVSRAIEKLDALPTRDPLMIKALRGVGYTQLEIAELLGATEKAVEMALYRAKRSRRRRPR